jgi:hypothetical protein
MAGCGQGTVAVGYHLGSQLGYPLTRWITILVSCAIGSEPFELGLRAERTARIGRYTAQICAIHA